jgi:hypothetical protein
MEELFYEIQSTYLHPEFLGNFQPKILTKITKELIFQTLDLSMELTQNRNFESSCANFMGISQLMIRAFEVEDITNNANVQQEKR